METRSRRKLMIKMAQTMKARMLKIKKKKMKKQPRRNSLVLKLKKERTES
jgi:hypothetical protein